MHTGLIEGFFAYPSDPPSIGETIKDAIRKINSGGIVRIKSWEQCRVGGKTIIREICREIENSSLFCADLTGLNPNILFELGFAIAQEKRIWLIFDTSFSEVKRRFDQLHLLTSIGYKNYSNSSQIIQEFYNDRPFEDLDATIFRHSIQPNLQPVTTKKLLYLKNRIDTQSSIRITERMEQSPVPLVVDDPRESTTQSLTWYGINTFSAIGVVCHLMHPEREGALLHNARYALAAGLAHGLRKELVMLVESMFLAPLDYRELLYHYTTATEALDHLDGWLKPIEANWTQNRNFRRSQPSEVELATELKGLQLGEPIAENEAEQLVDYYFVETKAYEDALEGKNTVFVGRKGSGKSANFLKLAAELGIDRRILVCQIKPVSYQLQSIADLVRRFKELDTKSYVVESLWKFLIYTEIANTVLQEMQQPSSAERNSDQQLLFDMMDERDGMLKRDFPIRLERCVESLELSQHSPNRSKSIEDSRTAISEALHEGILKRLRLVLGRLLSNKKRVVILIDNLDKAWDKQSDLTSLSEFFLGLMSAARRITMDFSRQDNRRDSVNLNVVVFLRSDIFYKIKSVAREPDKLDNSKLSWNDPEFLLRVIEERFVALHAGNVSPSEMWSRYFCSTVKGIATKDYFVQQILPRPRDLIFFIKAAVTTAVNRRHAFVEEKDVLDAEKLYSQFAVDSLLVENGVSVGSLEEIVYEFLGGKCLLTYQEIEQNLQNLNIPQSGIADVLDHLCSLSFFGVEVKENDFRFAEDPQENRKNQVLARKLSESRGAPMRYKVNRPFWAFLEVTGREND